MTNAALGMNERWHILVGSFLCLLLLSSCASQATSTNMTPTAGVTPTAGLHYTPGILPHFSDWRAAYLGPDGHAHVVTLDGKTNLIGAPLPDLSSNGLNISSAGIGADGKTFAYAPTSLNLVDITGQTPPRAINVYGGVYNIVWSPDSSKMYSWSGPDSIMYVTLADGKATTVTPGHGIRGEVGWIDNTHLAAVSYANYLTDNHGNQNATTATLDSFDITTNQVRVIATIHDGSGVIFNFIISPDGSQALYYNDPDNQFEGGPFTPTVALINLASGHITWLSRITAATGGQFSGLAWRPGSDTIAVSNGGSIVKTWLLDVAADTATQIPPTGNPVGWAPDNGPLVLSSGWQTGIGLGQYTLTAVTCASGAQCTDVTLTKDAMTFPFLGFAHNP